MDTCGSGQLPKWSECSVCVKCVCKLPTPPRVLFVVAEGCVILRDQVEMIKYDEQDGALNNIANLPSGNERE